MCALGREIKSVKLMRIRDLSFKQKQTWIAPLCRVWTRSRTSSTGAKLAHPKYAWSFMPRCMQESIPYGFPSLLEHAESYHTCSVIAGIADTARVKKTDPSRSVYLMVCICVWKRASIESSTHQLDTGYGEAQRVP